MADTYPAISDFARAFAAEYSGFMKANDVKGFQIAEVLRRAPSYVSDRTSGKRALDTDDVDALASLVEGWTGRELMLELARRTRETSSIAPLIQLHRAVDVAPSEEDHQDVDEQAAAKSKSRDRGEEPEAP